MVESQPAIIIDPEASPEQKDALLRFQQAAIDFTMEELLAAMETVETYPGATDNLLIFTRRLGRSGLLLAAWRDMIDTDAIADTLFDQETEDAIEANTRFNELRPRLSAPRPGTIQSKREEQITPEAAKKEITRLRFAIFAGRLASAAHSEAATEPLVDLGQTG